MNTKNFNSLTTNNLKKIEQLIWDSFKQGVKNKKSSFHYPTIATCGNKTFNLRTVNTRVNSRCALQIWCDMSHVTEHPEANLYSRFVIY